MYLTFILFIVGFALLIRGADILVEGSSSIAKRHGISNLVIGLTVVAFGTSAPELIVNLIASVNKNSGIALGNVIGSNIANILLGLGLAAMIRPMLVKKSTLYKEIPFFLLSVVAVYVLLNDEFFNHFGNNSLARADGIMLIMFFVIFMYYTFGLSKIKGGVLDDLIEEKVHVHSSAKSITMIVLGTLSLFVGGRWIVNGAVSLTDLFGFKETFIGLTLVAMGTSLPEITASAMAAKKNHVDIAVGNIVGTNIFNFLWVLGVSSLINPISYNIILNFDLQLLFIITVLLLFLIFFGKKNILGRWEGGLLVGIYFLYLIFIINRG